MGNATVRRPAGGAREQFREVMAEFPTFVTVVTAAGPDGPVGCTANAVMALSLEPCSLVVSLSSAGRTVRHVERAGRFAINLLAWRQRLLAYQFANPDPARRFDDLPHHSEHGAPVLSDAAATLVCHLDRAVPALDHILLIGRVIWSRLGGSRRSRAPRLLPACNDAAVTARGGGCGWMNGGADQWPWTSRFRC